MKQNVFNKLITPALVGIFITSMVNLWISYQNSNVQKHLEELKQELQQELYLKTDKYNTLRNTKVHLIQEFNPLNDPYFLRPFKIKIARFGRKGVSSSLGIKIRLHLVVEQNLVDASARYIISLRERYLKNLLLYMTIRDLLDHDSKFYLDMSIERIGFANKYNVDDILNCLNRLKSSPYQNIVVVKDVPEQERLSINLISENNNWGYFEICSGLFEQILPMERFPDKLIKIIDIELAGLTKIH